MEDPFDRPRSHPSTPAHMSWAYELPCHWHVGPTVSEQGTRSSFDLRRTVVKGIPLPLFEDFAQRDGAAFGGKAIVRFPHTARPALHGRPWRFRCEQPSVCDMWLPNNCIYHNNTLELVRAQQRKKAPPPLGSTNSRPVTHQPRRSAPAPSSRAIPTAVSWR